MYVSSERLPIIGTTGIYYPLTSIKPPLKATPENSLNFSLNFVPLKYIETSNNLSLVTYMPAHPPTIIENNEIIFGAPIKSEGENMVYGYRSGARSALIPVRESNNNDKWVIAYLNNKKYTPDNNGNILFRLKGCGMYTLDNKLKFPGITIEDAEYLRTDNLDNNMKYIEIRGVSFPNTSSSELYTLNMLKNFFDKCDILLGNIPIGFWEYKNLNNDPAPLRRKCVCIMESFGDKRLEAHLLTGLEKLFDKLIPEDECKNAVLEINNLFNKYKLNPPNDKNRTFSRANKFPYSLFTNEIQKKINNDKFPILIENFLDNEEKLIENNFILPEKIISILEKYSKINNLIKFYCKLGYEAGRILSLIHRSGFVWGTYVDYDTMGIHCNSHGDNMIILNKEKSMKKNGKYQILSPIDFDMSFNYENAINVWENKNFNDITIVTDHFYSEVNSLGGDLAGITSVIEGIFTNIRAREQPKGIYNDLIWIFRDVIYIEFLRSYNHPLRNEIWDCGIDFSYYLINVCLDATKDIES